MKEKIVEKYSKISNIQRKQIEGIDLNEKKRNKTILSSLLLNFYNRSWCGKKKRTQKGEIRKYNNTFADTQKL